MLKKFKIHRLAQYLTFSFLVLTCSASVSALAQVAGKGSIQGTVSDSTGARVPNAVVTILDTATNTKFSTKADGSGLYGFPNIVPSTYTLTVAAQGFETYIKTNNVLEIGSSISLNVSMTVGQQDQTVEVKAEGLALQTEDVSYKQTIDGQEIVEMPLNGRKVTDLLQLAGGANNAGGNDFTGSKYSYAAVSISIAGGMGNSSLWRLDGADNGDHMAGANLPLPFPDAVGQFSVENSALGAQDGTHAGGMINTVTKSGTNKFHGDAFEFIRNNIIDATNFTALPCTNGRTPPNCGKDTLHFDQFGGTVGGPVWIPKLYNGRDKLFFFAGFQYTRSKSATASSFAYVPTAANLAGDYTVEAGVPTNAPGTGATVGTAPNPLCKSNLTQLLDPMTGNPVPGNRYPTPPTWNAQSLALLKYLPPIVPLADGSDVCGHVQYSIPSQNFDKQFITRIDYTINSKNHLYGRYLLDSYQLPAFFSPTNILLTAASGNPEERVQTGTIGEDHTFRNNLVNSAHIAILRRLNNRGYNSDVINACTVGVNITCAVSSGLQLSTGGNIGGSTVGFSMGGAGNSLSHFNDNTLAINDDVTWILGKHQLVFGGEFVRNQLNISNAFQSNGAFGFGSSYSSYGPYGSQNQSALNGNYCSTCSTQPTQRGNGQLDFLEGTMGGIGQSKQQQNALRSSDPALYVQDVFHATKRLTIVAGLRWDPFYQPIDVRNRGVNFNFNDYVAGTHSTVYPTAPAGMLFYGDPGVLRTFTQSSPNQWDPNLGFTLDLYGNGKTVLRGGAEYIYDLPNNFTTQRNQQNPPFATSTGQSLNSYDSFSNPYSVPVLPANSGPGAANASTLTANPFPNGSDFVGVPTKGTACVTSPSTTVNCPIFGSNGSYVVPVAKFHPAVYAQWTASIQQDFGKGWLVNLQYIGNKGNHEVWGSALSPTILIPGYSSGIAGPNNCATTIAGVNYWLGEFPGSAAVPAAGAACSTNNGSNENARQKLNLINPAQGALIGGLTINSSGYSTYEGLVVSVNHRLSSTFSLLANYTWSKCLDLNESNGDQTGINGMNPLNPKMDYGPCSFDYRHVANFVLVVKSGFHFNNRAERLILNNWELSGLSHISTGGPFSVTTGQDDDLVGNPGGDRASIIPGVPVYLPKQKYLQGFPAGHNAYLNPAAFLNFSNVGAYLTPPTSTASVYGNTGRNQFVGPPSIGFDGQVSRLWPIHEGMNLTTRLEAYNLLNHPNFTEGNNSLTNGSTFGQITGVSSPARVFQGVVKFVF